MRTENEMASTGGFFRRVVPLVGLLVLLVAPTPSTNAQCTQVVCTAPDACHSAGVCDPDTGTCSTPQITCEDGNPCTADSCDPSSGCVFQPATGFEAVTCLLVTSTLEPAVCRPVPAKIAKLMARAQSQIALAVSGESPRLQKQLLGKAMRTLKRATKSTRRVAKRRGLSPLCADALKRVLGNLTNHVDQLRRTL